VVFGSWDGRCYCVRLSDGKEYWRWQVGDPGVRLFAPPAVANGRVYVGAWEDRKIHALDLGTGKPLAGYEAKSGYSTKVSLVQGLAVYRGLVATCNDRLGQLIDPNNGEVLCRYVGLGSKLLPALPAFSGERIYLPCSPQGTRLSAALSRAKARPDEKRRAERFKSPVLNAPLVGGRLLVAATEAGTLEVRRLPEEQSDEVSQIVWEWKSPSSAEIHTAPAAAAGFIVVGSDDGHVYAFRHAGR
jgi:outer membrane protein assembly factor BamB